MAKVTLFPVLVLHRLLLLLGLVALAATVAVDAAAAVPGTVLVEGVLTSSGGGAAADGNYKVAFAVYKDETGGTALWTETEVFITVKGGAFAFALGAKTPLTAQVLADFGGKAWFGLKIEADPELPRKPLTSVFSSLRSGVAEAVDCTGCIKAGHLDGAVLGAYVKTADLAKVAVSGDFADLKGGPDLTAYAKTSALAKVATSGAFADLIGGPDLSAYAKLAALSDYAKLASLADVAKSGNYADLKGLPTMAKVGASCGTGLVVKGIKSDGSHECVLALDPANLPPDAIDEVSNGLIANQFQDSTAGTPDVVIKDGFLFGVADNLTFPDIGIAQKLVVSVHLQNSDIGSVVVSVFDPAGVEHLLHSDKLAKGTEIKTSYPTPTKQLTNDLTTWVGKNPKGTWTLKVVDSGSPTGGFTDGKVVKWSVDIQTLSSKKVQVKGDLIMEGMLQLKVSDTHPVTCDATRFGQMYANKKDNAMYLCNGKAWFGLPIDAVPTSCKDVLKMDSSAKDGLYTIDPDGPFSDPPFKAYCDMTTDGGGWMLVMQVASTASSDGTLGWSASQWTNPNVLNDTPPTQLTNINAKYGMFNTFKVPVGKVLLRDKKTNKFTSLSIPGFAGKTLLDRFLSLGKTNLTVTAGAPSPQELMGFPPVSGMCSGNGPWMINMLSNHSGVRLGNDVASNSLTTNNQSSWLCYDNGCNLSYSGAGGTLESGKQWQDGWGSEALNRWRDNGGTGQGSHNGVALFVQ